MGSVAKILLVEDEAYFENLFKRSFENSRKRFDVDFAHNLSQALTLLQSTRYMLLITDLMLPDGSGFDLLNHLKKNQIDIPSILVTCRGNEHLAAEAIKNGVSEYLVKNPQVFLELPLVAERVIREWENKHQQQRMQQKLIESELRYRRLVESVSDVIWITDPTFTRYMYVCPAITPFLGYTQKEATHMHVNHILSYESSKKVEKILQDIREQLDWGEMKECPVCFETELVFEHKDGSTRWGDVKASLIMRGKKVIGLVGITRDITDRKIAESKTRELEKLRQHVRINERVERIKEQFLANLSHEVRTPLTGILGMSELLMKSPLNEQQKLFLDTILTSSQSLLTMLDNIMDLSRIKEGKMELLPVDFDLHEHANRIIQLFWALIRQKSLESSLYLDPELPGMIRTDQFRLEQIATNLLSNAIKFTDQGFISLSYILLDSTPDGWMIRLQVEDSGIGISREDQQRLFVPFSQVDISDTRSYEGAGLGLAVCQRFARLMGTRILLESTPGKGSRFWMDFWARKVEPGKPGAADAEKLELPEEIPCNVLLVEDKKTNQLVVSLMLQQAGCSVDIASHGKEALEMFDPGKYQLILMDIQMPVMDGLTATRELRKKYPGHQIPPIVALSAQAMQGDAEYYISEGLDDYLTKPVSSGLLQQKIYYWVRKGQKEAED